MKKCMVKGIALLLAVICMCAGLPLLSPNSAITAQAAYESSYSPLSDQEALALIGFLCDTSKVTEEMKEVGDMYDLLTGRLELGSQEEIVARLAFSSFAAAAINKNIKDANLTVSVSTEYLLEYLNEQAGGDIDGGLASEIFDEYKNSVKGVLRYMLDISEEAVENYEFVTKSYDSIVSIPSKAQQIVKDISAAFNAAFLIVGQNKRAQYSYVATRIDNMSCPAYSNPDVAEIMDAYNSFATANNNMFAGLAGGERWNNVDNKELLDTFAEFIYSVNKSNGTVSSSQSTVVEVHCPTDVQVTDADGELLVHIENDQVVFTTETSFAAVNSSQKLIVLPEKADYIVTITGTDEGTMNYSVKTYNECGVLREIGFEDVPVTNGGTYTAEVSQEVFSDRENFALEDELGNVIQPVYDSLPDIDVSINDVIIEEELIDGLPTDLIDKVADAIYHMKSEVDVLAYDITAEDGVAVFSAVAKYYPCEYSLISKSGFRYKMICDSTTGAVKKIRLYYGEGVDLTDYQQRVNDLNAEVESIVAGTVGMSDFEKALYLHDYIVLNCKYDTELYQMVDAGLVTEEIYSERYTEYSVLINGTGICGSYALAYRTLMNKAGVECIYLVSQEMNHAWNMIKLDGEWYHVDCCWDDPTPDQYGSVRRNYFLLNDTEIRALDHYGWAPAGYPSTSTKYSDMPRNVDSKQKYAAGKWYYYQDRGLYCCDNGGTHVTQIGTATATAIAADGGHVYYSSGKRIYRWDAETEKSVLIYMLPDHLAGENPESAYISNFYVDGTALDLYITAVNSSDEYEKMRKADSFDPLKYTSVTGISLAESQLEIPVLSTHVLTAEILSTGSVEGMQLQWKSSDETVATVDENGTVTACNIGSAVITASFMEYTAQCVVTVTGDGSSGTAGGVVWNFDGATGRFTISGGSMNDYSESYVPWKNIKSQIRSVVIESGVTSISSYAFAGCSNLETVIIADSVKSLGRFAFRNCSKLKEVVLPDGLTFIGNGCFQSCIQLASINLPEGITGIEGSTFLSCIALKSIVLPENLEYIYNYAFNHTGLESIVIPDKVTIIAQYAFQSCPYLEEIHLGASVQTLQDRFCVESPALKKITVDEANAYYSHDEAGLLYNKDKSTLVVFPAGSDLTEYQVPGTVTAIAKYAFSYNKHVRRITLPNSVLTIDTGAFVSCASLEEVDFGDSLQSIANDVFAYCKKLKTLELPDSLKTIGNYAFRQCVSLQEPDLGNGLKNVGTYVFMECAGMKKIEIPASITELSEGFCRDCTSLEQVVLPDTLKVIGSWAFSQCIKMQEVTLPAGLTTIGTSSFAHCSSLKSVKIPASVSTLTPYSFSECESLESIFVDENNSYFSSDEHGILFNKDKTQLILCPSGHTGTCYLPKTVTTLDVYQALNSAYLLEEMEVEDGNTSFCSVDGVLYSADKSVMMYYPNNKQEKVFVIKDFVKEIDSFAFGICHALETLIFECQMDALYESFYSCPNLTALIFEENAKINDCSLYLERMADVVIKNVNFVPQIMYGPYVYGETEERMPTYVHTGSAMAEQAEWNGLELIDMDAIPHEHTYLLVGHSLVRSGCDGYERYECYCGDAYFEEILHKYSEILTEKPSCVDGERYYSCENCAKKIVVEILPATGQHNYQLKSETPGDCQVAATYTYECTICLESYVETGDTDRGHRYHETVVDATCSSKGYTMAECEICGEASVYDYTAPLPHEMITDYVEATCKELGYYIHHCENCELTYQETDETSELGDHIKDTRETEAKCEEAGLIQVYCTVCEEVLEETVLDPLEHIYVVYVSDENATCEEDGTKTAECEHGCGAKDTVEDEGSALGHSFVTYVSDENATCEEDGTKTAECEHGCGAKDTVEDEGSALGHSFVTYVSDENATCEEDGTKTAECEHGCGAKDTVEDEGSALGHSFVTYVSDENATCEEDGTKTAECDHGCGKKDTIADEGSALGHDFQNYLSDENATCEEDGTKTAECERQCGAKDTILDEGSALGHDFQTYVSDENATCEEDGTKTAECERQCGAKDTILDEGSALGHSFVTYVSDENATCEEDGTKTAECERGCGVKDTILDEGSALGHDFVNYVSDENATCEEDGTKTAECERGCGVKDTILDEGSALGHDFVNYVSDENATCLEDGTKTAECERECGTKDTIADEGSALGHSFVTYVSDENATCEEDGTKTAECERECGVKDTILDEGSALGHDFVNYVSDENATCLEDGTKTAECERECGAKDTVVDEGSAFGHDWDDGIVTRRPTTTRVGIMLYTCLICGDTYEDEIPMKEPCEGGEDCLISHFTDVDSSHWAHEGIEFAVEMGLMKGTHDGTTFSPDMNMDRSMLVTVLHRYSGSPDFEACDFEDVDPDDWFYPGVAWAAENGIVKGVGDGTCFDPSGAVTREMMATILFRYAQQIGLDTSKKEDISEYPDAHKVGDWAREAMEWAVGEEIITGAMKEGTVVLAPQDSANRAVVATIMMRFIQNVVEVQ